MKMYPYSLDFTDSRGDILTVMKILKNEVFEGKKIHLCEYFFALVQHNACVPTLLRMHTMMEIRRFKKGKQVVRSWAVGEILTDHVSK